MFFFSESTHFLATPVFKERAGGNCFRRGGAKILSASIVMQEWQKEASPRQAQRGRESLFSEHAIVGLIPLSQQMRACFCTWDHFSLETLYHSINTTCTVNALGFISLVGKIDFSPLQLGQMLVHGIASQV